MIRPMAPSGRRQITAGSGHRGRILEAASVTREEIGRVRMVNPGVPEASTEARRLEQRKRRLYQVALTFGIVVTALSWAGREPDDTFIAVVYPLLAAVLLLFALLLAGPRIRVRTVEVGMLGAVGAVVMARLAWHFHLLGPIEEQLLVLVGGHYWSVAALMVGAFVALDRREATVLGLAVWAGSALIAVTGVGPELWTGEVSPDPRLYLVRVHGFLALLLALVAAVATLREQLHRALARAEALDELATTDPVTGLANRRAAEALLERLEREASRYGQPFSVALVDLDHFKDINDRYGHAAGDRVLVGAAHTLRRETRESDVVARWGGEEFLVVAPATRLSEATRLAERCRTALATTEAEGRSTTASFGVAELVPGESIDTLVARADARLYAAKRGGRDRVVGG